MQYIPFTRAYELNKQKKIECELNKSMEFIRHIHNFNTEHKKKHNINCEEREASYKRFEHMVATKSFTDRFECVELANDISPGLGMTEVVATIVSIFGLKNPEWCGIRNN